MGDLGVGSGREELPLLMLAKAAECEVNEMREPRGGTRSRKITITPLSQTRIN